MPRPVALITGPTSGIGAGYARRYASDGYDLVLVARDVDRLTALAGELRDRAGNIEILPADLGDAADRQRVAERLAAGVRVLVNNAGFAGLLPGRGSTYSASKAWVISFSEGLSVGLQGTGVSVHAVCPGYVRTEFHARAGIDMSKSPSFLWLQVDDVVDQSLADIARGKVISIPGLQYKAIVAAERLIPRTLMRAITKRVGGGRGRT
ncbi:SDR family NAD(P)-dependent oxidoreductase [Mycobacterium avium subsp. paratuberculosis]|nr:SDR family NAD(P)-dependent oxidoreductase [Mycobacterium avium subsp. paratuberculosis]